YNTYNGMTYEGVGQALLDAGYSSGDVMAFMSSIRVPINTAAEVFQKLGIPGKEVVKLLATAYNWVTQEGIASAMRYGKYAINEIADGLKTFYNLTEEGVAYVLNKAQFAAEEVARFFKDVYHKTAAEVADILKKTYNIGAEAAGKILQGIGYAANQVADALKSAFNWVADIY
ncbi:MAG TPA: hypothetical protein VEC12_01760, partial [Bacteroidia bacterium]|nr:hypothetical protein [Bacteroidia bacterium]